MVVVVVEDSNLIEIYTRWMNESHPLKNSSKYRPIILKLPPNEYTIEIQNL